MQTLEFTNRLFLLYREFLEGKSYYAIGQGLTADGIRTAAGNNYWHCSTLKNILMNEKYIGDAFLQKTVTTDFLTKKRVVNNGIVPKYYVENNHEAIIPREVYMKVQEEMVRRAGVRERSGNRHVYSGKHAFSSIVCCALCGDIFQRCHWFIRDERLPVWRCARRRKHKEDCLSRTVYERDLQAAFVWTVNEIIARKDDLLPGRKAAIEKALGSGNDAKVAEIDTGLEDLEKELLRRANANGDYTEILEQIDTLRGEKQELLLEDAITRISGVTSMRSRLFWKSRKRRWRILTRALSGNFSNG